MEEESIVKKQKKKTLVSSNESPKKMEKSSDDNVKIPTITSDEELADRQNKLKSKNPKETSRRKGKAKKKETGVSMYGKVKESSKRGQNRSKKRQRPPQQKQKSNDVVIRAFYSKTKNRVQKGKAQSNARNQEGLMCPDDISKQIDVPEEYETEMMKTVVDPEVSAVSGLFPMNNENNGRLFIRGVPFWCLKDEKPPVVNCVGMSTTLKDLIDKKFILLKELPEPNNLDPFHEMNIMTSRDEEYFKDKNRLLSNTVRSMVAANELKKTSEMRPPNVSTRSNVLGFRAPTNIRVYNRKNRLEAMATVPITTGVLARKKRGIVANFFA